MLFRHFLLVSFSRNIVAHDHEQVVIILRPTILLLLTLLYLIDIIAYSMGRGLPVGVPLLFTWPRGGVWTPARVYGGSTDLSCSRKNQHFSNRSDKSRVGKECVRSFRSWLSAVL